MNVLEKILEEIEEKFKTADAEKCDCEELCEVEDWYDSGYIDGQLSAHEKCMDIIRSHMDEMNNDDWIPVEERLPSDEIGEVLTQNRQEYMLIGYFSYNENMGWYECESDEALLTDVVAWRPLMEPYRPKEKNNE